MINYYNDCYYSNLLLWYCKIDIMDDYDCLNSPSECHIMRFPEVPHTIIHFRLGFSYQKPSSYGGTPLAMENPRCPPFVQVSWGRPRTFPPSRSFQVHWVEVRRDPGRNYPESTPKNSWDLWWFMDVHPKGGFDSSAYSIRLEYCQQALPVPSCSWTFATCGPNKEAATFCEATIEATIGIANFPAQAPNSSNCPSTIKRHTKWA